MKKILVSTFVVFVFMVSVVFARGPMPPPPLAPENPYYQINPTASPTPGTCGGAGHTTMSIDYKNGTRQEVTLDGNCAASWVLPPSGYYTNVNLKVIQHTGAHYGITWTSTKWAEGLVPLITQQDGAIDFISCDLDSLGVYCMFGSQFQ